MHDSDTNFWKRKLAAYLHDPPSKAVDIHWHEQHARTLYRQAGFTDEEELRRLDVNFAKPSDWTASSADRLPFPRSRGNLSSVFDGVRAGFHHPLSPSDQKWCFNSEFPSAEAAMAVDQITQPRIDEDGLPQAELWRARFFAHWRLWESACVKNDARFALLPADTRIPDHTIWPHMQVASALDGCAEGYGKEAVLRPAFLKFQIGGVQEFISQARSIRDLWSGSYLLSWLMAAGLKALALEVGPDSVIFPNLKGQPLFDLHLREDLWSKLMLNAKNGWKHVEPNDQGSLLTPNLPNVFLAVVPQGRAKELGQLVVEAIHNEWLRITAAVWKFADDSGMIPDNEAGFSRIARKERFDAQVKRHLSISWQATAWPDTLDGTLTLADDFAADMPIRKARERVLAVIRYATETMPESDRDGRYYAGGNDGPKTKLNNIGLGWSVILALNGWQLDAARQLRSFNAPAAGARGTGTFQNKDSLGGNVEAVAGGRSWLAAAQEKNGAWKSLFKHEDWLGAATLIKRLWHLAYLAKEPWNLPVDSHSMPIPDTRQIALGLDGDDSDEPPVEDATGDKYFAVLALDGDSVGQWVSGEKTPRIGDQVSSYTDADGKVEQGAKKYFKDHGGEEFLNTNRPLSPSYHLQFSAALSNFALQCADRIVRHFKGRLIYSGGDDVLAMLPADQSLACARALRAAFRGTDPHVPGISSPAPGYLHFAGYEDDLKHPIPVIVPGPEADCSVGIAIAHFKSPLQDAVRAAQAAEKRAKKLPGKAAVAVTVLKRSGETVEWAAKWENDGVQAAFTLLDALHDGVVSSKFPYRLAELMSVYRTASTGLMRERKTFQPTEGFKVEEVFVQELATVLSRQRGPKWETGGRAFQDKFTAQTSAWLDWMLQKPAPKSGDKPLTPDQETEAESKRLNEAISQLTALCAFCGFAKRLD